MTVVIETNILLVSVSPKSKYHWVYQYFLAKKFNLAVSTEILFEYEEILSRFMGIKVAQSVVMTIAYASNTTLISRWYCWNLINSDPDDNKFVDAFIASGADLLITEDKHFDVLKNNSFPSVQVMNLSSFYALLHSEK